MNSFDPLIERILPEYRRRHIFTMKLRLVAFAGFWVIYLYFLRDVLGQAKAVAAVVFASFLATGLAYYNVMRGRLLSASFATELLSDLTAITAVVYLTGGPYSPHYTIYIFYAFIAGVLYNHYLAAIVAAVAAAYYGAFLLLCNSGVIPPLILDYGDRLPIPTYTPFAHFLFAAIFLAGIVYTVRIASYFSQQRERILERRNRELMALHRMSSTIRSATALRGVIEQLLAGVLDGLNFEAAAFIHFDWPRGVAVIYVPARVPRLVEIERMLGKRVDGMEIPVDALPAAIMQEMRKHRIIFRKGLAELAEGFEGFITAGQCDRIQEMIGARRIVVMPVIVGEEALGALIGFSGEPFVEEGQVATLESFANQSALSLEAAALIDRLRRVNENLKEANRVKSEFLAAMSHELRTPLTAIIGFSELIIEGVMGEITDEQRESLSEVLHNAADLLDLINSLLDLTKIESGKMRFDLGTFNVGEVFKRVLGTISPLVQKKGQDLVVAIPEALPPISGDERKVQQVILNLLANANKFTPEGGQISASVRSFDSWEDIKERAAWWRHIEPAIGAFKRGGVEVVVEDNGIGIEADHLDRIFEMFHQVDGSATRSFGGTGVGLALAKKFVEMHGGRIWVESELGKGAKFMVVLPRFSISS